MEISPSQIDENISLLEHDSNLTNQEAAIFSLIRSTCQEFNPPVIARVAGGWVRDKIIGRPSDDIDIAVDTVSGLNFAEKLREKSDNPNARITVIEAKPDNSKHLETVRVCITTGFWIDVCCLRHDIDSNEVHTQSLGNPTPDEDARRRDFTVNALFFNINENKVEDFVGGIEDLKKKVIRTPLHPDVSFGDDPLRVLRAYRFAARYGFEFDDSIIPSARKVKNDFRIKISKERIADELKKSIDLSDNPSNMIKFLIDCELFDSIFNNEGTLNIDQESALNRVNIVFSRGKTDKSLILTLGAIYSPVLKFEGINASFKRHKKEHPIYTIITGLKMPAKTAEEVLLLLTGADEVKELKDNLNRVSVGNWVRRIGSEWRYVKYLIFDDELYQFCSNELEDFVNSNLLGEAYDLKPLINGIELAKIHGIKPGAALKQLINSLIDWQLENPSGNIDDYLLFINSQKK